MIRLFVIVEGQTEEEIVKVLLKEHLERRNIFTSTLVVHTKAGYRGGGRNWKKWEREIRRVLTSQRGRDVRVTTMFDLFRLPNGFPGLDQYGMEKDTNKRCDALERTMAGVFDDWRFIPYLQRHEVEALVLGSIEALPKFFDESDALRGIDALATEIFGQDPEDIDDGPETAPSKRLIRWIPGYQKSVHGPMAIHDTGLESLRARCPRFAHWVAKLEELDVSR